MIRSKKTKPQSEISTASMPDIVFLLLFFFMVSATIKTEEHDLKIKPPVAEAITSVNKKFLIRELHVGFPSEAARPGVPKISDGKKFMEVRHLGQWVEIQRSTLAENYQDQMIVLIKADEAVDMGLIGDIQLELRKHNARKVLFKTLETV